MSEPISPGAAGGRGSQQLNKLLGTNTVLFHATHRPPDLKATAPVKAFGGGVPNPGVLATTGGTPNQKAERIANRLAVFHFVQANSGQAEAALADALDFFRGQLRTGHQCIGRADESLTASHSPIWWRAIASFRITTHALAERGGDYATLASLVLDWIQFHTSLNTLGEIPSGTNAGKVLLPGSRWKGGEGDADCVCVTPVSEGKAYVKEPLTDQLNNVVHQLIKKGGAPWDLSPKFFTLRDDAPDLAGAALARQIIDSGIGFGEAATFRLPRLRSKLVVQRFANGHRAFFPEGMPFAGKPALEAFADYESGQICLSRTIGACPSPAFSGEMVETVVEAVPA
jgi:hypothetical protein